MNNSHFDAWNELKKQIDIRSGRVRYHAGDIWWCELGKNIGYEQDGKGPSFERPVLVIKDFNQHICLVVPLTTRFKDNVFHASVGVLRGAMNYAILSQIRLIDTRRFTNKAGHIIHAELVLIKKAIHNLIG